MKPLRIICLTVIVFLLQATIVNAQENLALKAEIKLINERMVDAVVNQNLAEIINFYTEDAIALPDFQPMLKGKEAIRKHNEKDISEGSKLTDMKLITEQVVGSGDMVYEIGTYDITFAPEEIGGEPMTDYGKYLTVWQRVNGQWKIKVEMWNTDRTPVEIIQSMGNNSSMNK